jgi:hypothetical protein
MYTVTVNGKEVLRTAYSRCAIREAKRIIAIAARESLEYDFGTEVVVMDLMDTLRPQIVVEYNVRFALNRAYYTTNVVNFQ